MFNLNMPKITNPITGIARALNPQQTPENTSIMPTCKKYEKKENKDPYFKLKPRQDLCIHRFDEFSSTSGMLLLHNVGSGKTITSLTLAINSINWDLNMTFKTNKNKRTILILHPTGLLDEFMSEIQTKILNIKRTNDDCVTDANTGIRQYKFEKKIDGERTPRPFYIESIQYNELAKFFNKYDDSIEEIRTIFLNKIVIIDEAHRLFRQFDICDPKSMIISKYINDNLMAGAQKIIAMTGTPLKNNISDMLSLFRFINLANIYNFVGNPLYRQSETRKFDIANKLTYKELVKTRIKIINPNYWSAIQVKFKRTQMAFYDFINAERSDLSTQFPNYTDSYIKSCSKLNYEVKRKGEIMSRLEYVKYLFSDLLGSQNPTITDYFRQEFDEIKKNISPIQQQQTGGSGNIHKNSKTKKMRGGNITSLNQAQRILEIKQDLSSMSLEEIKKQYISLASKWHPDKCITVRKPACTKKFQEINEAWQFIEKNKHGENMSEYDNNEEFKIQDYYSTVTKFSILEAFSDWTDEEILNFSQNMIYHLKNTNSDYISLDDLLTEFSVTDPMYYSDILVSDLNEFKGLKSDFFEYFSQNYENINENYFKVYFKLDYELFNNLYVKETVQLIQDIPQSEINQQSAQQTQPSEELTGGDSKITTNNNNNILYIDSDKTNSDKTNDNNNNNLYSDFDIQEDKSILYSDFDIPNEINYSIFLDKIKKNQDNNDELKKIISPFSQETIQIIQKNLPDIKKTIDEIKIPLNKLIDSFNLMIEQEGTEQKPIEQSGGFLPVILFAAKNNLSEHNLVAPYKLIGDTALSVDNAITFCTLFTILASIIL